MYGIKIVEIYLNNVFPLYYHDHWTSKWSFLLLIGCIESSYYEWGSIRKNFWLDWVGLAMNTTCQEGGVWISYALMTCGKRKLHVSKRWIPVGNNVQSLNENYQFTF